MAVSATLFGLLTVSLSSLTAFVDTRVRVSLGCSGIEGLSVSPEAQLAAISTAQGNISTFELDESSPRDFCKLVPLHWKDARPVRSLAWSSGGRHIYAASGQTVVVFGKKRT